MGHYNVLQTAPAPAWSGAASESPDESDSDGKEYPAAPAWSGAALESPEKHDSAGMEHDVENNIDDSDSKGKDVPDENTTASAGKRSFGAKYVPNVGPAC